MEETIRTKLMNLLACDDDTEVAFLSRLTETEQSRLIELIGRRIEKDGNLLLALMGKLAGFVPAFLRAKLGQNFIGPELAAKMISHVPIQVAIDTARAMKTGYLADVAVYMDPEKAAGLVDKIPDKLMIQLYYALIERDRADVMAQLVDVAALDTIIRLVKKINDVDGFIQVALQMKNHQRLVAASMAMSDDFLLALMKEIDESGHYELAARVGEGVDLDRQLRLMQKLDTAQIARLSIHYNPALAAKLLEHLDIESAIEIALLTPSQVLGQVVNFADADAINSLLPFFPDEKLKACLPYMDLERMATKWAALSPAVMEKCRALAEDFRPLRDFLNRRV